MKDKIKNNLIFNDEIKKKLNKIEMFKGKIKNKYFNK